MGVQIGMIDIGVMQLADRCAHRLDQPDTGWPGPADGLGQRHRIVQPFGHNGGAVSDPASLIRGGHGSRYRQTLRMQLIEQRKFRKRSGSLLGYPQVALVDKATDQSTAMVVAQYGFAPGRGKIPGGIASAIGNLDCLIAPGSWRKNFNTGRNGKVRMYADTMMHLTHWP